MRSTHLILLVIFLLVQNGFGQDTEAIFQKGNSLHSQGKYKEALEQVNLSLSMDSSLYQRYHFRAEIKENLGMIDSAIDDITKCIDRCTCPKRSFHVSSYLLKRANLHVLNENYNAALDDLDSSISNNPQNVLSYDLKSELLYQFGDKEEALKHLDKSIQVFDDNELSYMLRARLRLQTGNVDGACQDFRKLVEFGYDEMEAWIILNCKK